METVNSLIDRMIALFMNVFNGGFVGIKNYRSASTGRVSNIVLNAKIDYGKAKADSIAILNSLTESDFSAIAEKYGVTSYTAIARRFYKQECAVCGFDEVIDVHHIDCDRDNNNPDNLIYLCPNHHALLHRKNDTEVLNVITGHGTAWGGHLPCTEEISRVRISGGPPKFALKIICDPLYYIVEE